MKNIFSFVLAFCPLIAIAQGSYEPSYSCDKLARIIEMYENNTIDELVKLGTETESSYSKHVLDYEPELFPDNFTTGKVTYHTAFEFWTLHFSAKSLAPNQAQEYYNNINDCLVDWTKTESIMEIPEDDGFDLDENGDPVYYGYQRGYILYEYEYLNSNNSIKIKIELTVYENESEIIMVISQTQE